MSTKRICCAALGILGLLTPGLESQAAAPPPNVIFIITDDQGYGDLSSHGNPILKTPNLDRLRAESLRFTDFHVAPMCTPTRGELMTGLDAFRNGATAVCEGRSMPRRELPMMPRFFQDNGYATAHFGKWHLGDNHPYRPQDRGFELSLRNQAWGVQSLAEHWENDCFDDRYWLNDTLQQFKGYNTDVFFEEAMQWMKQQRRPFFVFLATTAAHSPFNVPPQYAAPYQSSAKGVANFFGMIANIDENVGRLEAFLKENRLRENTVLIFMTDNGTVAGDKIFNAGMRDRKTSAYEGGHRVPFFLRWPAGGLGAPRDIAALTHGTDLLPTLLDLCGLANKRGASFDGRSLRPLIEGKENALDDRKVVIQYRAEFRKWSGAVLWKKWRLVNGKELYDVATDPGQQQNISDQHPEVVQTMRDHYEAWCARIDPVMNQPNYISLGTPQEKVTWLSACNWTGSYCDNWSNLATPGRLGHWNLQVEAGGEYEVRMYLFHPDSQTPLTRPLRNVRARPVAAARLLAAGQESNVKTAPEDTHAVFNLRLEEGQRLTLEGQFLDTEGNPLMGGVYTFVTKK